LSNYLDITGKKRGEIGAYYFQLRHGMAGSYIAAFLQLQVGGLA
jgi:hypothetical protein